MRALNVKRVGRAAHRDSAAQVAFSTVVQPDTLSQVQRLLIDNARDKGRVYRTGFFQTACVQRLQRDQIARHNIQGQCFIIQFQRFTLFFAHQQRAQLFRRRRGLQLFSHRIIAQHMRQLTQQAQVLVAAGSDTDCHVSNLTVAPHHTLRELINLNAGFQHLIAGVRCTVRNGDAIAEESGGLLLARQHAVNVAVRDITRLHKGSGNLANGLFFVPGLSARVDILNR